MPARLYNGMIHGLEPYTLKGFLWFQGDGNFGNPQEYGELVKTLIRARAAPMLARRHAALLLRGDAELPQAAAKSRRAKPDEPHYREEAAARRFCNCPSTDVAASLDQGIDKPNYEAHFPDKKQFGQRLAGLALNNLYGQTGLVNSPARSSVMQWTVCSQGAPEV